jgi:uncharacterized metal-binding protein
MALSSECMLSCAQIALDTADIVRDRDLTPTDNIFRVATNQELRQENVVSENTPLLRAFGLASPVS